MFSALFDKNPSKTVDYLIQQNYEIVLTSFKDVRFKELSQIALNNTSIINIPNFVDAFKYAYSKTDPNSVLLLTGSIHFLSIILTNEEITQYLNINKNHLD
jgi:folylpolyglutamate synthase/dihydropteroate synthase